MGSRRHSTTAGVVWHAHQMNRSLQCRRRMAVVLVCWAPCLTQPLRRQHVKAQVISTLVEQAVVSAHELQASSAMTTPAESSLGSAVSFVALGCVCVQCSVSTCVTHSYAAAACTSAQKTAPLAPWCLPGSAVVVARVPDALAWRTFCRSDRALRAPSRGARSVVSIPLQAGRDCRCSCVVA